MPIRLPGGRASGVQVACSQSTTLSALVLHGAGCGWVLFINVHIYALLSLQCNQMDALPVCTCCELGLSHCQIVSPRDYEPFSLAQHFSFTDFAQGNYPQDVNK